MLWGAVDSAKPIRLVRSRNRRALEISGAEKCVAEHLEVFAVKVLDGQVTSASRAELAQRLVASVLALVRTQL